MIANHIKRFVVALALLWPAAAAAQPQPFTATTLKATDATATALCVGCPIATLVPAANSGARVATITIDPLVAPTITTNKLYSVSGALTWNGVTLATGSTIAGTTNTIGLFTGVAAMGNSLLTQSGSTVTMAGTLAATTHTGAHSGNGSLLTNLPTSAVSTGNFVATVASGTGITSSVTTGNAAATTISLNNTAVTPAGYGSSTAIPVVTIDQQGRVTLASTAVVIAPAGTLTGTTLAATVVGPASAWTVPGILTVNGFGAHAHSAGGVGANELYVRNTTACTTCEGAFYVGNDQSLARFRFEMMASTYTPSTRYLADGAVIESVGVGGLSIVASDAGGAIRFYAGGVAEVLKLQSTAFVSSTAGAVSLGTTILHFGALFATSAQLKIGAAFATVIPGTGAPGGACQAGSLFLRSDGGATTTLYVCSPGNVWTAK